MCFISNYQCTLFAGGQVVVNYFSAKICAICGKVCIFLKIINQKFQLWEIYLIT